MKRLFYSTGQAARELATGQTHVRRLCERGLIESILTPGGQYRIPVDAVKKAQGQGLPEVPRELATDLVLPEGPVRPHPNLLAEPSTDAIQAADEVVRLENEVKAVELTRRREEGLDWFRDRKRREEKEQAERCAEQFAAGAEARRHEWENEWVDEALALVPGDAPREIKLDVIRMVRAGLAEERPESPGWLVEQVVEAAVDKSLQPWRREREIAAIILEATERLPWFAKNLLQPTQWQLRATELAAQRIAQLWERASLAEIRAAADAAVAQVTQEFEQAEAIDEMVRDTWMCIPGYNFDELADAKHAVKMALAALKVGASRREMEKTRDAALAPVRAAIARRQEQEMREQVVARANLPFGLTSEERQAAAEEIEQAVDEVPPGTSRQRVEEARQRVIEQYCSRLERREKKRHLIETGANAIYPYLLELEKEYDFDRSAWAMESDLKGPIEKQLEDEFSGNEPEDQVMKRVRRLVRKKIGIR